MYFEPGKKSQSLKRKTLFWFNVLSSNIIFQNFINDSNSIYTVIKLWFNRNLVLEVSGPVIKTYLIIILTNKIWQTTAINYFFEQKMLTNTSKEIKYCIWPYLNTNVLALFNSWYKYVLVRGGGGGGGAYYKEKIFAILIKV